MELLQKINEIIVYPAVMLIFTAGLVLFLYGLFNYLWISAQSGENRSEAVQHMLWGVVGMFIMVSVQAIIAIIIGTIGADPKAPDISRINSVSPGNVFNLQ